MEGHPALFRLGRQPIFDSRLVVHGYELLPGGEHLVDDEAVTADVLVHTGLDVGLVGLVGDKRAFVGVSRQYLVGDQDLPFPPNKVVVEVPGGLARATEVVAGCRQLTLNGYDIALDGCACGEDDDPLLQFASIVRLDAQATSGSQLSEAVLHCSAYGVKLLAEKVERRQELLKFEALGFDLYQGHLLSRPEFVEGRALTPATLACLRSLDRLCDPTSSFEEVEAVVKTDGALSARFLRAAGAGSAKGLFRRLRSVRDALVVLGERRLRAWLSLMLVAGTREGCEEQFLIAMTRARMAELMAEHADPALADAAFTVGLVSALDLLLGVPLLAVVEPMSLSPEVEEAVLGHSGALGAILSDVLALEFGDTSATGLSGLGGEVIGRCYLGALAWANELCGAFRAKEDRRALSARLDGYLPSSGGPS